MLLLGTGHCFRDQVLEVCPELSRYSQASDGIQKTFEGSSLETIRHMVASGIGITVLPWTAMPAGVRERGFDGATTVATSAAGGDGVVAAETRRDGLLTYIPFHPIAPTRRVVLAWRKSFTRTAAIAVLRQAILDLNQPGVTPLPDEKPTTH
jgi:LysR family hydrogen peroxide-inducible transcriptional activator